MAARKSNPRLLLQLLGIIAVVTGVGLGLGIPFLLLSKSGTSINDTAAFSRITFMLFGGGVGLGVVLIVMSFFVKGAEG